MEARCCVCKVYNPLYRARRLRYGRRANVSSFAYWGHIMEREVSDGYRRTKQSVVYSVASQTCVPRSDKCRRAGRDGRFVTEITAQYFIFNDVNVANRPSVVALSVNPLENRCWYNFSDCNAGQ